MQIITTKHCLLHKKCYICTNKVASLAKCKKHAQDVRGAAVVIFTEFSNKPLQVTEHKQETPDTGASNTKHGNATLQHQKFKNKENKHNKLLL